MHYGCILQLIKNQSIPSGQLPSTRLLSKADIVVGKEQNIILTFCMNCTWLFREHTLSITLKCKVIKVHWQGCKHLLEANEQRVVNVKLDADSMHLALCSKYHYKLVLRTVQSFLTVCEMLSLRWVIILGMWKRVDMARSDVEDIIRFGER